MAAGSNARAARPDVGCGCFGDFSHAPVNWRTLTRSALLSLAAFSSLLIGPIETGVSKFAAVYTVERAPGKMATLVFGSVRVVGPYLAGLLLAAVPLTYLVGRTLSLGGFRPLEVVGLIAASGVVVARAADHSAAQYALTVFVTIVFCVSNVNPLFIMVFAGLLGWLGLV